ncbi:hypothetical protein CHLRE_01g024601v5 [Chlamydomonas reinhardtii]|uniref:Nuclease associated modular domain-containing protein n=1 Tax=Chlamydomonas reinhardtii TaxID=3055 RepID=A0A2K3E6B0_CHLRE|nr:uncharacterized protein CHLRE_01g024601v5 [Chlamydomonas reinhardtii]PNW88328.1 hypothetical protein CHLRE_01g024601v5 [Chlamydomonas reinhardtii]
MERPSRRCCGSSSPWAMSALPKEFVRSTKANLGNTYGKGLKGLKRSAAVKAKIAAALKGKNPTAETKAKMPAAMKGHTDRKGKKGTARSAETKAEVLATNSEGAGARTDGRRSGQARASVTFVRGE